VLLLLLLTHLILQVSQTQDIKDRAAEQEQLLRSQVCVCVCVCLCVCVCVMSIVADGCCVTVFHGIYRTFSFNRHARRSARLIKLMT